MYRLLISAKVGRDHQPVFTEVDSSRISDITAPNLIGVLAQKYGVSQHWVEILSVTVLKDDSDILDAVSDFCDGLDSMMNTLSSEEIADRLMETVKSAL